MKKFIALWLALLVLIVPALADSQAGYINEDTTVRMAASEKALSQGTALEGTKVMVEDEIADDSGMFSWYKVTFVRSGDSGFVKSDDVDLVIEKKQTQVKKAVIKKGEKVQNEKDYPVLSASGVLTVEQLMKDADLTQYEPLAVGDSSQATRRMKDRLHDLGYITSDVTSNKYTEGIVNYVKAFQKKNGLAEDSTVTPQMQALLYSDYALNKKGEPAAGADPLAITKASVRDKQGTYISFSFRNNTKEKIDALDIQSVWYDTYGKRYCITDTLQDELQIWRISEERLTIPARQTATLEGLMVPNAYLAGGMIAVSRYHLASGETVTIPDDQYHWYGFGKGVPEKYQPLTVTPLTDREQAAAEEYPLGVTGVYVDKDFAEAYQVREGMLVDTLTPGSPLDEAGLQAGDVLLAVGDTRIFGQTSVSRAAASVAPGDSVTVLYWRNGDVYVTEFTRPDGSASV